MRQSMRSHRFCTGQSKIRRLFWQTLWRRVAEPSTRNQPWCAAPISFSTSAAVRYFRTQVHFMMFGVNLGELSGFPRGADAEPARSRLAIHRRRFLVPSRIAFRLCSYARCRLDRYGESNNTLNFYNLMTIRTYRNAFRNLSRDPFRPQPEPSCFTDAERFTFGEPVMEFQDARVGIATATTFCRTL
jgi:hypothetical protein